MEEASLVEAASGLVPAGDGWFSVNVADAAWVTNDAFGARCSFEANGPALRRNPELGEHLFPELGFKLQMAGAPTEDGTIIYGDSDFARSPGAGAEAETGSPHEAYAQYPHWQPGCPDEKGLPWT
jgi:hypothetical protein